MMHTSLLRKFSIGYLMLPNLLFSYGWFREPYAAGLILGMLYLFSREFLLPVTDNKFFKSKEVLFLVMLALVFTFFTGAGGFSQQKSDFFAHNAKFYDLFKNPWPTYFAEVDRYACYYFGYYLVPAAFAKLIGQLTPVSIYLWTALGYFLGFSWLYLLLNRRKWLLFAFFWIRGIGYILYLFFQKTQWLQIPIYRPVINGLIQHASYVPNQFLGTLIITTMLLHEIFIDKRIDRMAFPITLNFIWGVFPTITLTLIYLGIVIRHYGGGGRWRLLLHGKTLPNYLLPALLMFPTFGYFLSANGSTIKGFIWTFDPPVNSLLNYILGFGLDLFLYAYILWTLRDRQNLIPRWFISGLLVLLVGLSCYRMGYHNDWFYRTQIPIFIVLVIAMLLGAESYINKKQWPSSLLTKAAYALVVAMMLLQLSSYVHLIKNNVIVKTLAPGVTQFQPMTYDRYPNVYQLMKDVYRDRGDAEQYLGDKDSFYQRYLARDSGQ